MIDDLVKKYPNDLRVVIKHFPLSNHKQAKKAAMYAVAAERQNKFLEMEHKIFKNFSFKEIGYADYGDWDCFSSIVGEEEVKNLRKIYFDCDDYAETTWTVLLYHNFTFVTLVRD